MDTPQGIVATAVTDLTGEGFKSVRQRLTDWDVWTGLVVSANEDQALLEALMLSGLAACPAQEHPFGVVETSRAEADLLLLRLESTAAVEAVLDLLPYRDRRGTRRGVPGLQAQVVGNRLDLTASFGDKTGIRWNVADPKVRIHVPGDKPIAAVLQARYDRVVSERCIPHWMPGAQPEPPRRRPPLIRDVVSQHRASARLASAVLRRPRMWAALTGHQRLVVVSTLSAHGLDWTIGRTVVRGAQLHDPRLVELLQDEITGYGLRLLDHLCHTESCTVRLIGPGSSAGGWSGILTVRTEHGISPTGHPGRPLAALGEPPTASRPASRIQAKPQRSRGRCIALVSVPFSGDSPSDTQVDAAAVRLSTAWAAKGHVAAVLTINQRGIHMPWERLRAPWQEAVPEPVGDAERWTRLRLAPAPGQAWSGTLTLRDDGDIEAVLEAARERYSRILVLDRRSFVRRGLRDWKDVDALALVFPADPYPRQAVPAEWLRRFDGDRAIDLAPKDSAARWREQYLGQRDLSPLPLVGLVPLHDDNQQPLPDAFTYQVEEHLARFGTPVLGWFPDALTEGHVRHRNKVKTALDPMKEEDRARLIAAASGIGSRMW